MQPVWNGSEFEPRLMLPLSFSYDHRVIDGAQAVRFTTFLGQKLADVETLVAGDPVVSESNSRFRTSVTSRMSRSSKCSSRQGTR